MLIDTHCHIDAAEFDHDREHVLSAARRRGVQGIVIPAIAPANFSVVADWAERIAGGAYALGIHPLCVAQVDDAALAQLREALLAARSDPRLVAVGEIGLDRFEPGVAEGEAWDRQWRFYRAQLELAREFELPVLLHVRRAVDWILKGLRQVQGVGGIAHAFNGSHQQANALIERGVALGMGGAMTYPRARQIRRLAVDIPLAHLVLETDAPDIPPAWLEGDARRNTPAEVAEIARVLAELRELEVDAVIHATGRTAMQHLPRLARVLTPLE